MAKSKKSYKSVKQPINKKGKATKMPAASTKKTRPLGKLTAKFLLISVLLLGILVYFDNTNRFAADQVNNHTQKKWDWFYKLTKRNNIDVLLLGNSHVYTGINPKTLSAALGVNSFILASPGTNIADSYFTLREALRKTKPKLVIVETFPINNFNPYELRDGDLTDQIKSFASRETSLEKITSTTRLFNLENYPYAWSETIRNHNYIFTNQDQLEKNKKLKKNKKKPKKDKLYLGRYVRFTTGLTDSLLAIYKNKDAPVDGADYDYNVFTERYTKKIVNLCERENIQLIFLTVPMYKDHVENYDLWKNKLTKLMEGTNIPWLDLQEEIYFSDFPPSAFENTYKPNQHLTYNGSLVATYKLAHFIKEKCDVEFPNRRGEQKWNNMFYSEEGYCENNRPKSKDKKVVFLTDSVKGRNIVIKEIYASEINKKKYFQLVAKIDRKKLKDLDADKTYLSLLIKYKIKGKDQISRVDLKPDKLHRPLLHANYTNIIRPIKEIEVVDAMLMIEK